MIAKLKKKADTYFSKYIRQRDVDHTGYGECITCGRSYHWKDAQAGHFVSRKTNKLRFDERNVNLQCVGCNMFKSGEQWVYGKELDKKYGDGTADELMSKRHETYKFTVTELEEIIEYSKENLRWK
jgi:hypothetical protein